jgi:hypothetical protein
MASMSERADRRAALGFRAHSGWAAMVALAGPAAEPEAVLRRRLELAVREPRQPFHAAEQLPFGAAEDLVRRATDEARALSERGVRDALGELEAAGHAPAAAGLLLAAGRSLPGLREILGSHALIHAAEGELYRDVLRRASLGCGLATIEVGERDLDARVARSLRGAPAAIQARLAQWGKALGPPWTQDEKRAALVAWIALSDTPERAR